MCQVNLTNKVKTDPMLSNIATLKVSQSPV